MFNSQTVYSLKIIIKAYNITQNERKTIKTLHLHTVYSKKHRVSCMDPIDLDHLHFLRLKKKKKKDHTCNTHAHTHAYTL